MKKGKKSLKVIKEDLRKIPKLSHYSQTAKNIISTDASTHGLGAVLWQEYNKELRPIAFASRFLNEAEKKYAINELELLAVVWGLEHFRFFYMVKKLR